jgi:hypothetical protein
MTSIKRLFSVVLFGLLISASACFADSGYSKSLCEASRDLELQTLKSTIKQELHAKASSAYEHNHFMLRDAIERLRDSTDDFRFPADPEMSRQSFRDLVSRMQKAYTFFRTCGKDCDNSLDERFSSEQGSNLGSFLDARVLSKNLKDSVNARIHFSHGLADQEVREKFTAWGPRFPTGTWNEECFGINECGYSIVKDYPSTAVEGNYLTYCQNYPSDNFTGTLRDSQLNYSVSDSANSKQTSVCSRLNLSTLQWQDLALDVTSYNVSIAKADDAKSKPTSLELYLMNEQTPECPKVTCGYEIYNEVYLFCK